MAASIPMNPSIRWSAALIALLLAGAAAAYLWRSEEARLSDLQDCALDTADPDEMAACLSDTVPRLLAAYPAQEILRYLSASSTPPETADECHAIAHATGVNLYRNTGSIEAALAQCAPGCRNGCAHGAIGEGLLSELGEIYPEEDIAHAGAKELADQGRKYCMPGSSLCHAMGHVAYLATEDDRASIALCDSLSDDALQRENCYQGIFMERAGSGAGVLFTTDKGTPRPEAASDYTYPCMTVSEAARHACFLFINQYQIPLFTADGLNIGIDRLPKAVSVCESLSGSDRADCFTGLSASAFVFDFKSINADDADAICSKLREPSDRDACTLGLVSTFSFTDFRGISAYCKNINESRRRTLCYDMSFMWLESDRNTGAEGLCRTDEVCAAQYRIHEERRASLPDYRFGLYGER